MEELLRGILEEIKGLRSDFREYNSKAVSSYEQSKAQAEGKIENILSLLPENMKAGVRSALNQK